MTDRTKAEALHRFYNMVDKAMRPDECWAWQGTLTRQGYGYFRSDCGDPTNLAH